MAFKPTYLEGDNFITNLYEEIREYPEGRSTLSLVQFTDLHLDLEYAPGSAIKCDNVMCCRADDGYPEDPALQAGPMGSLAICDVPKEVLYKMGDKVNELKPDALFWTGDVVPHDQW